MGTRRKFTEEFKREAVKLATQPGVALTTVSRELGVERSVLRRPVESTQYTSEDFQRLLSTHSITCSMSRRGDCWDTQSRMNSNVRPGLTRAGTGRTALALTCRPKSGVPRARCRAARL